MALSRPNLRSLKVLALGSVLLAASAVLAASVAREARLDWFDQIGLAWIPADASSPAYIWLARIGSPALLLAALLAGAALAVMNDRTRAVASLVGPTLAVLVGDLIAKPIVDRQLVSGHLAYPSGTEVAVAAVATALVLASRGRGRRLAFLLAGAAAFGVGIGVVGLRWHYPTDVLGGVLLGSGCVLVVDAILHMLRPQRQHGDWPGVKGPDRGLTAAAE